jgi:hypothetical protein
MTPQMARKNLQQQQAPSAALLHQSSIGKLLHHRRHSFIDCSGK